MLGKKLRDVPTGTPGVYCFYDLDDTPAYAGQSSDIRSRLRQHLVRQDSSVVSYGRLDVWDISRLEWWETSDKDVSEEALLHERAPYLNFGDGSKSAVQNAPISLEHPDGEVRLLSQEEQEFREEPYTRSKQKLEHISRMLDKIKLAGHSASTKRTLYEHQRILQTNIAEFLDLDESEQVNFEYSFDE
ncbi:GIY-YIG nuclease family protein [Halorubellus litoreus]|uniref:GIY-YIG nuclease family protein n=1 Tax=Halorubellus litoreus TaxID=755308 RepID=A0ABD5VHA3_9EURY